MADSRKATRAGDSRRVLPSSAKITLAGSISLVPLLLLPVIHIALLSLVGHKEWRFILYAIPLLNVVSAIGAAYLWQQGAQRQPPSNGMARILGLVVRWVPVLLLGLTLLTTAVSTVASTGNYPGGEALAWLHRLAGEGKEMGPCK